MSGSLPAALSDILLLRSALRPRGGRTATVRHPVHVSLTAVVRLGVFSQMSMPLPRRRRPPARARTTAQTGYDGAGRTGTR